MGEHAVGTETLEEIKLQPSVGGYGGNPVDLIVLDQYHAT